MLTVAGSAYLIALQKGRIRDQCEQHKEHSAQCDCVEVYKTYYKLRLDAFKSIYDGSAAVSDSSRHGVGCTMHRVCDLEQALQGRVRGLAAQAAPSAKAACAAYVAGAALSGAAFAGLVDELAALCRTGLCDCGEGTRVVEATW